MKYSDAGALPPCELSAHCLRLLNDLDAPGDERAFNQALSTSAQDRQDQYLIEKLRAHLPDCPTCSAKLASARQVRSQQRMALRRYLVDAESSVPSTTERILTVAQQMLPGETEQPPASHKRQGYVLPEVFVPLTLPKSNGHSNGNGHFTYATNEQSASHSGHWLRNGFALAAAAALLFAALGMFNHFVLHAGPQTVQEEGKSWPSVIIGVSLLSSIPGMARLTNVYNVDTTSGEGEQLTPPPQPTPEARYESVSPDGKDVLYDFSSQGQTVYTTLQTVKGRGYVARIPANDASNAIWMDNDHILVAHVHSGVEEFDIHTGASVKQFAPLVNVYLLFYHSPYLYFQDAQQTVIYRINLLLSDQQQAIVVASGLNFTGCVLNPNGSGIYCEGQSDKVSRSGSDLYMVNGDGSGVKSLARRGTLLGFAADHALLYLQVALNSYQVVKLGRTPQQDQVVMKNAAPATAIVGAGDAMLAPDGHGLVVQDSNLADSSRGVWYDDLTAQTSRELFTYVPGSSGHLIGWDRLPVVNATTPTPDVTVSVSPTAKKVAPTVTTLDPFGGWGGVVLITGTGSTYNFIGTYNYLNGDHRALANVGGNIQFDGVASSGLDMLYHVNSGERTLYYTLHPLPGTGYFFALNQDDALNAIWMPDSIHALIATVDDGVIEVNTHTGRSQALLPSLQVQALKFYRDGYLYFLGGPDRAGDTLFRINVASGVVQQITMRSMGGDFWLSPDGLTVYFKNGGPVGQPGVYAVSSDGTRGGVIRPDGMPVGYAADDLLVIMREVNHQFELVQVGAVPQQDRVLLDNVAPGALSLCDPSFGADTICDSTNVALAPYSHALIVVASYPDGSRKVWSDDLVTGRQSVMQTLSQTTALMVPGWDRITVP